jgi:small-conductance mechanosensitive channel
MVGCLNQPMNNKTILSRNVALAAIAAMAVCGCMLVALVPDRGGGPGIVNAVLIGAVFGTLFGQVALAAAWCALGPFALASRLPLAAGWVAALVLALGCLIARDGPDDGALGTLLVFAASLTGQWLVVQGPLWLLVAVLGVRVCHCDEIKLGTGSRNQQFGIGQLMLLTLIVGVVLGGGRFLIGGLSSGNTSVSDWRQMVGIFVLALFQAVMALPLIAAGFVRSKTAIAVLCALGLVVLATWLEVPVLALIDGSAPSWPEYWMFWFASGIQTFWILAVVLVLRAGGYRLVTCASGKSAS